MLSWEVGIMLSTWCFWDNDNERRYSYSVVIRYSREIDK